MSKKKSPTLNLLILGGSQGIGATTYNYLVSNGHRVFTSQSNPPIASLDDAYDRGFFYYMDYLQPSTAVGLVTEFVEKDIKLDGLLFCDEYSESQPKFLWNAFDYRDTFLQNVIGPTQLLIYLEKHEVLKYAVPTIFTTESRKVGSEYLPYGAASASLPSYLDFVAKTYPLNSEILYIDRPDENDALSWDSYTEAVLKVFAEGYSGMGKKVSY